MKLILTSEELKSGERITRYGVKTLAKFVDACALRKAARIDSLPLDGKMYRVVVLTSIETTSTGHHRVKFQPIWGRAFRACGKEGDLKLIVVDFGDRKLQFDSRGHSASTFTTSGPGVGREIKDEAEELFGKIVDDDEEAPVKSLIRYLGEFTRTQPPKE